MSIVPTASRLSFHSHPSGGSEREEEKEQDNDSGKSRTRMKKGAACKRS